MNIDGQRIKAERTRRAMSQEELANATGLHVKTISRMELEGSGLPKSLKAVAEVFGLDAGELVPSAFSAGMDRMIQHELRLKADMENHLSFCTNLDRQNPQKIIVIDAARRDSYPEGDLDELAGASAWFVAYVHELYHDGISLLLIPRGNGSIDRRGMWRTRPSNYSEPDAFILDFAGRIPFRNIVGVDYRGDDIYQAPKLYCHYINGDPCTSYRFLRKEPSGFLAPLFAENRDPSDPDYHKLPMAGDV